MINAYRSTAPDISIHRTRAGARPHKESGMATERELTDKLWKALRSDRTVMLGLTGVDDGHSQPMTALLADDQPRGPIWFFTTIDTDLVKALGEGHRASAQFASKGHDLFASIHGELVATNDPAMVDKLWNPFASAWFEGGKTDPKLQLLRLDPEHAEVWLNENSLFAGVKLLLGRDPKKDYRDKVGEVNLAS
jgi:general stress protein 26